MIRRPTGIATGADALYVVDTGNRSIRRVTLDAIHSVSTVAGNGYSAGFADGPAANARLMPLFAWPCAHRCPLRRIPERAHPRHRERRGRHHCRKRPIGGRRRAGAGRSVQPAGWDRGAPRWDDRGGGSRRLDDSLDPALNRVRPLAPGRQAYLRTPGCLPSFPACHTSALASHSSLSACGQGTPGRGQAGPRWTPVRTGYVNPIVAENQLAGDVSWNQFTRSAGGQVEAYAERVSAKSWRERPDHGPLQRGCGRELTLYRVGWYGGAGARTDRCRHRSARNPSLRARTRPRPASCAARGRPRFPSRSRGRGERPVPGPHRPRRQGGRIRPARRPRRPARPTCSFQSSVLTAQAYNNLGRRRALLRFGRPPSRGICRQVSFDRPHGQRRRFGAGCFATKRSWPASSSGTAYDVTYTTNLDVVREGPPLSCGAGRSSRWAMTNTGQAKSGTPSRPRATPGCQSCSSARTPAYWKVRLSGSGADGNARVVTCYKRRPQDDPLHGTPPADRPVPDDSIGRPEEELVGTMYESWLLFGQPWVVVNPDHPIYTGRGPLGGNTIPQARRLRVRSDLLAGYAGKGDSGARSPVVERGRKDQLLRGDHVHGPERRPGVRAGTIYFARASTGRGAIHASSEWPRTS